MKRLPGLLVALIVLVGCLPPVVEPGPTSTWLAAPSTTSGGADPTSTPVDPTTTTIPPGPPVAWITPSGIPLPVVAANGDTIEVLTPCGNPVLATAGTPVSAVDVLIDPGHGGPVDTGAVGANGLQEKDINLDVALAVHDILTGRGIAAMLTRTADYPVPIRTRSRFSDLVGARALVSIHHNAPVALPSDIPGVEIFVKAAARESARLGGLIYDETMAALGRFEVEWHRAPDAGVMSVLNTEGEDAYGMVRLPDAPSALVELGYIANPAEAELFEDPAYVSVAANAVADAIETFLTSDDEGAQLVEGRVFNPQRGVGRDRCVEPNLMLRSGDAGTGPLSRR